MSLPWNLERSHRSSPPAETLYNRYPICGALTCFGVLFMFITERLSLDAMAAFEEAHCEEAAAAAAKAAEKDCEAAAEREAGGDADVTVDVHSHEHLSALAGARAIVAKHAGHGHQVGVSAGGSGRGGRAEAGGDDDEEAAGSGDAASPPTAPPPPPPHAHGHSHAGEHGHSHAHSHGGSGGGRRRGGDGESGKGDVSERRLAFRGDSNSHAHGGGGHGGGHGHAHGALVLAALAPGAPQLDARRRVITAELMELSIVTHSLIIGLNLGTTPADPSGSLRKPIGLIIVLCFHQAFEGIALGSYIAELRAAASFRAKLFMASVFVAAVPFGCWVGIGVSSTYDPQTLTGAWVTGALNAVTGGMLLYTALFTFLAEEFSRDDLGHGAAGRQMKREMYIAVVLGTACMGFIAIWA